MAKAKTRRMCAEVLYATKAGETLTAADIADRVPYTSREIGYAMNRLHNLGHFQKVGRRDTSGCAGVWRRL